MGRRRALAASLAQSWENLYDLGGERLGVVVAGALPNLSST